jgi:tripartite ATP-independent transporter DctP family solute receptor
MNLNRSVIAVLLGIALVFAAQGVFANGATEKSSSTPGSSSSQAKTPAKPITFRISTTSVPADWHTKALYVFKDYLDKNAPGQFDVQIFPSSSLIPADAEFGALQRNNIQFAYVSAQTLAQNGFKQILPLTAGYVVKSPGELRALWHSPLGEKWSGEISKKFGFHTLGEAYLGTRELNLRFARKIMTPADLAGVKLRMPPAPAWIFLGKALGANPTPLAFSELYLGLQTGTVDGQDNPLPTDKAAKFYEVTKQIVLTNHLVDGIILMTNDATWNSLNPEQKKVMDGAAAAAIKYNNENRIKDEADLIAFFKSKGLDVYSPDVAAFRKHVLDAYMNSPESKDWPPNIIQELDAIPTAP